MLALQTCCRGIRQQPRKCHGQKERDASPDVSMDSSDVPGASMAPAGRILNDTCGEDVQRTANAKATLAFACRARQGGQSNHQMPAAMSMVVTGRRSILAWNVQCECAKITVTHVGSARPPSILGVNSIGMLVISKTTRARDEHLQCPWVVHMAEAKFG